MPSKCAQCDAPGVTTVCSSCKDTYYCNQKCQRKHWKTHKKECYKFKPAYSQNRTVGVRIHFKQNGKSMIGWANAKIIELLPDLTYRVRLDDATNRIHPNYNLQSLIQIVKQTELREESVKMMKLDLNKETDILDLYLQGRDCKDVIKLMINEMKDRVQISEITLRFVSMSILEYIFEAGYKWRIQCFWCPSKDEHVQMRRCSARSRCILYGAHTLYDFIDDYSIYLFCDECNSKIHYDDIIYGCDNQEHDICLKCVYNKKIVPYMDLMEQIQPILMEYVDLNCARVVIEYIAGEVIQFK